MLQDCEAVNLVVFLSRNLYTIEKASMDITPSSIEGSLHMCIVFCEETECSASSIVTDEARGASGSRERERERRLISSIRIISVDVFPFFSVTSRSRPIHVYVTFYFNV